MLTLTAAAMLLFSLIVAFWLLLRKFRFRIRPFDRFMIRLRKFLRKMKILRKKRRHDRKMKKQS